MTSRSIFYVLFAVLLLVASCKEDDETPSKTELLTAKSWSITAYTLNGHDVLDSYFLKCDEDDSTKFGKDGKVTNDNGTTKCDSSEGQTEDGGTWTFDSNETQLKLTSDGDSETFTIDELTATTLKLSTIHTETINGSTVSAKLVITLTGK